jgi:hypothetical protein
VQTVIRAKTSAQTVVRQAATLPFTLRRANWAVKGEQTAIEASSTARGHAAARSCVGTAEGEQVRVAARDGHHDDERQPQDDAAEVVEHRPCARSMSKPRHGTTAIWKDARPRRCELLCYAAGLEE